MGLTSINYAVLTGYDFLAFAYIGRRLPGVQVALASFLSYAVSNNVGFAMLSGASVRYRFYTRWGLTGEELSRIVFSYSVTFWLGLLALGGVSLAVSPVPLLRGWARVRRRRPAGCWRRLRRRTSRPPRWVEGPSPWALPLSAADPVALTQLALSVADWALAGAVLYVLLPTGAVPFLAFLGAFLAAILIGMASHVPGGLGVFEGLMVVLLKPYLHRARCCRRSSSSAPSTTSCLSWSRSSAWTLDEVHQRRAQAARVRATSAG